MFEFELYQEKPRNFYVNIALLTITFIGIYFYLFIKNIIDNYLINIQVDNGLFIVSTKNFDPKGLSIDEIDNGKIKIISEKKCFKVGNDIFTTFICEKDNIKLTIKKSENSLTYCLYSSQRLEFFKEIKKSQSLPKIHFFRIF